MLPEPLTGMGTDLRFQEVVDPRNRAQNVGVCIAGVLRHIGLMEFDAEPGRAGAHGRDGYDRNLVFQGQPGRAGRGHGVAAEEGNGGVVLQPAGGRERGRLRAALCAARAPGGEVCGKYMGVGPEEVIEREVEAETEVERGAG